SSISNTLETKTGDHFCLKYLPVSRTTSVFSLDLVDKTVAEGGIESDEEFIDDE
ncbi:unnamed protein product, partial [Rotaria sp. Silwood1]